MEPSFIENKPLLVNLFPSCSEAFVVDRAVRGEVNSHYVARAHLYDRLIKIANNDD